MVKKNSVLFTDSHNNPIASKHLRFKPKDRKLDIEGTVETHGVVFEPQTTNPKKGHHKDTTLWYDSVNSMLTLGSTGIDGWRLTGNSNVQEDNFIGPTNGADFTVRTGGSDSIYDRIKVMGYTGGYNGEVVVNASDVFIPAALSVYNGFISNNDTVAALGTISVGDGHIGTLGLIEGNQSIGTLGLIEGNQSIGTLGLNVGSESVGTLNLTIGDDSASFIGLALGDRTAGVIGYAPNSGYFNFFGYTGSTGITGINNTQIHHIGVIGAGGVDYSYIPNGVTGGIGVIGTGSRYGVAGVSVGQTGISETDGVWGGYFSQIRSDASLVSYALVGGIAGATDGGIAGTNYKILGNGIVSTVVKDIAGNDVIMVAPEACEALFEDCGAGQLVNGVCHIDLDPVFSFNIIVSMNDQNHCDHPLRVFIQLEDDCNGVFVQNKTGTGFDVKELNGGTSNAKFTYNVKASRKSTNSSNFCCTRFQKFNVIEHSLSNNVMMSSSNLHSSVMNAHTHLQVATAGAMAKKNKTPK
jgi:hypothetical protein